MTTTMISHSSFPISLFIQLVRRLRLTNARYNLIAYQCRCTQRPTHHARRRAYRAGLRIDTSKASAAWFGDDVQLSVSVSAASTRTAGSPVWVATETETETKAEEDDIDLPNPWPASPVIVQKRPSTPLSPLGLELRNIDEDLDNTSVFREPVPGAPRLGLKPLPAADECEGLVEAMTNKGLSSSSSGASCTYEPVWRGVVATHVSNSVLMSVDVGCADLGTTAAEHLRKRKLQDIDLEKNPRLSRRIEVAVQDDRFSGVRWGQRRWVGI